MDIRSSLALRQPAAIWVLRVLLGSSALLTALPSMAHGYGSLFDFVTMSCVLNQDSDSIYSEWLCEEQFPELRPEISEARELWKQRNAGALPRLKQRCEQRLGLVYKDYAVRPEEVPKIREAAHHAFRLLADAEPDFRRYPQRCREQIANLRTNVLTKKDIDQSMQEPPNLLFVQIKEPDFRRVAPLEIDANYQRDRGFNFAESLLLFNELKTGVTALDRHCLGVSVEYCAQSGQLDISATRPDQTERLDNGDERLTFLGKKILYHGTPKKNYPAGPEQRIFIVRDGRIVDAYQRMQLFVRPDEPLGKGSYSCERYGERVPATTICDPTSVE